MAKHIIEANDLKELLENNNQVFNLDEVKQDIVTYWTREANEPPTNEIMFVITLNELKTILSQDELGVCISNLTTSQTVSGRWKTNLISCAESDDFFILPHDIAKQWVDDPNVTDMSCIAARLAYNESRRGTFKYYVYFHKGEIELNIGDGAGGDDLATGVRVPSH